LTRSSAGRAPAARPAARAASTAARSGVPPSALPPPRTLPASGAHGKRCAAGIPAWSELGRVPLTVAPGGSWTRSGQPPHSACSREPSRPPGASVEEGALAHAAAAHRAPSGAAAAGGAALSLPPAARAAPTAVSASPGRCAGKSTCASPAPCCADAAAGAPDAAPPACRSWSALLTQLVPAAAPACACPLSGPHGARCGAAAQRREAAAVGAGARLSGACGAAGRSAERPLYATANWISAPPASCAAARRRGRERCASDFAAACSAGADSSQAASTGMMRDTNLAQRKPYQHPQCAAHKQASVIICGMPSRPSTCKPPPCLVQRVEPVAAKTPHYLLETLFFFVEPRAVHRSCPRHLLGACRRVQAPCQERTRIRGQGSRAQCSWGCYASGAGLLTPGAGSTAPPLARAGGPRTASCQSKGAAHCSWGRFRCSTSRTRRSTASPGLPRPRSSRQTAPLHASFTSASRGPGCASCAAAGRCSPGAGAGWPVSSAAAGPGPGALRYSPSTAVASRVALFSLRNAGLYAARLVLSGGTRGAQCVREHGPTECTRTCGSRTARRSPARRPPARRRPHTHTAAAPCILLRQLAHQPGAA